MQITAQTSSTPRDYNGSELGLFSQAVRWKAYVARRLSPFVRGAVLEVGAGIGANIQALVTSDVTDWLALEPDARLSGQIGAQIEQNSLPSLCSSMTGTIDDLPPGCRFDSILYIDVLEHIEDDRAEVVKAAAMLAPQGHLIVLVPAHQFLYTAFDRSIGHHRRYNLAALRALAPPSGGRVRTAFMLDSVGFFASLANRLIMQSAMPSAQQIMIWDRLMVPASRLLDPLLAYRFGKSAVLVWQAAS